MINGKIRRIIFLLCAILCISSVGLCACGTSDDSVETDTAETTGSDSDTSDENLVLSLEDGAEITLTKYSDDDAYIYGKYQHESDGSMWVFGGDTLSIGFLEEDGTMNVDIYNVGFYAVEENDYTDYALCLVLTNTLDGTSACWYAANVVDDDNNTEGIVIVNPSDETYYFHLTVVEEETETETESE